MDLENAKALLESDVYAACKLFETLEFEGRVYGNGHHMRQQIAAEASKLLIERWIEDKIV